MHTIGDQLKKLKRASFIGRENELQVFEQTLDNNTGNEEHPWQILNIYGPGGIGKSTLLDAYRRIAEKRSLLYFYLDAQDFAASSEVFLNLLSKSLAAAGIKTTADEESLIATLQQTAQKEPLVITIDTFEDVGELNRWLRERFIPHLPSACTVVIAGRYPLAELWKAQPIWQQLINPLPLKNFSRELTTEYLKLNGIDNNPLVERAWRNTDGYPLALSLSVMLAHKEGEEALATSTSNADIVTELTQRWLREIPDTKLRRFIEAAAIVRYFNQDLLGHIAGEEIDDQMFQQLVKSSFIRSGLKGWAIHSLVRNALNKELSQRSPEHHTALTLRALNTLAQMAITPSFDRGAALHEFFYMLGNSLVRATLYNEEIEPRSELFIESAASDDAPALQAYMNDWRNERGVLANTTLELIDSSTNQNITEEVTSEPREPEFINTDELLELFPGAIRLLKDQSNHIHGLSIVLPINAASIPYLEKQPVTGKYFAALNASELKELETPTEATDNWFVRLIDSRNPSDHSARAVLLRDLTAMLIRPARFITTTPLKLYQMLLMQFGFEASQLQPHFDFGKDRPAPFFILDLRGQKLALHLEKMIKHHMGAESSVPIKSLFASVIGPETNPETSPQTSAAQSKLEARLALDTLTAREKEVTQAAAEGLPNCSIAAKLGIGEVTVKKHMSNIFAKLGLRNRAELIKAYWVKKE